MALNEHAAVSRPCPSSAGRTSGKRGGAGSKGRCPWERSDPPRFFIRAKSRRDADAGNRGEDGPVTVSALRKWGREMGTGQAN